MLTHSFQRDDQQLIKNDLNATLTYQMLRSKKITVNGNERKKLSLPVYDTMHRWGVGGSNST